MATKQKPKIGKVLKRTSDKTAAVLVESKRSHEKYNKQIWISRKYQVHCTDDSVVVGDMVEIQPVRPISKTKRWRVIKKVTVN